MGTDGHHKTERTADTGRRNMLAIAGAVAATALAGCSNAAGAAETIASTGEALTADVYETLADLRAAHYPVSSPATCYVLGHGSDTDGGGGHFAWDASSLATDNDGTVVKPSTLYDTDPGRWLRLVNDDAAISVRWFGATGDGTTDDGAALQSAAAAASANGGSVYFPPGTYRTTLSLTLSDEVWLVGAGRDASTIQFAANASTDGLVWAGASAYGGTGGGLRDLTIRGSDRNHVRDVVSVQRWSGWTMQDCWIHHGGRNGLRVAGTLGVALVGDCKLYSCETANLYVSEYSSTEPTTRFHGQHVYSWASRSGPGVEIYHAQCHFGYLDVDSSCTASPWSNGYGVLLTGKVGIVIDKFVCENNAQDDIRAGTTDLVWLDIGTIHHSTGTNEQPGTYCLYLDQVMGGTLRGGKHNVNSRGIYMTSNCVGFRVQCSGGAYAGEDDPYVPEYDTAGGHDLSDYPGFVERVDQPARGNAILDGKYWLRFGGGDFVKWHATNTTTWNLTSGVADGAAASTTITVTGATVGDEATCGYDVGDNAVTLSAVVVAADTVRVTLVNHSGGSLAPNATLRASVWRH